METKEHYFLAIGGLLKLSDTTTTILYISLESFYDPLFFWLVFSFLVSPTFIFLLGFLLILLIQTLKPLQEKPLSLPRDLLILSEQLGLYSLLYSLEIIKNKIKVPESSSIFLLKSLNIVSALLESTPQLILQTYNSGQTGVAGGILISSCILSGFHLIYACCRFVQTYDRQARIQSVIDMMPAGESSKQTMHMHDITLEEIN